MAAIHKSLKITIALLIGLIGKSVYAQTSWPQEIKGSSGIITIYEPQPEELRGDNLFARAAVSIRQKSGDEPVFGVMWIEAQLISDAARRLSSLTQVVVRRAKFAETENIHVESFKKSVEQGFPTLCVQMETEGILTSIDQEQVGRDLKNDPPLILYRDKPTTLIVLDGEPLEERDEDLNMVRVVNTPYLIVKNPDDKKYYLYGGSFWYVSKKVKEGWTNVKKLPTKIKALDSKMKAEEKKAANDYEEVAKFTTPTEILVVTEPAELIQTEGRPTYQAVRGSTLLYVNNSLDEIFKDVDTQLNYVLLSGRWFSSVSFNGPWKYVPHEALPTAFASIPAGSEKDGVLVSVAGTEEAEEAIMDAYIPQTAKVDRSTARVDVDYDGAPYFVPIENTNLAIAENSNITVMRAPNNRYYALENGIWFISSDPYGPWQVANERPSDVDRIPPSSSAYNARYVYIYDTTPQYVYVGYTQGYMGNYICGPTVVWGTGWRYKPWKGRYYRPRPVTWGFGMHYNPWTGWNMSFGLVFNLGWYHYGYSRPHYGGGWFGPPAFRPPYRPWGWNGGYYGGRNSIYTRPDYASRARPVVKINRPAVVTTRPSNRTVTTNLYRDRSAVVVTRDAVRQPVPARSTTTRSSNSGNANTRPGTTRPSTGTTRPNSGTNRTTPSTTTPSRDTRPSGNTTTQPAQGTRPVGNDNARPTRETTTGSERRQPATTQPSSQPRSTTPAANQPATRQQPGAQQPRNQPATGQPSSQQRSTTPATTQPAIRQQPAVQQPKSQPAISPPAKTTQPAQQQPSRTTPTQRSAEPQRSQQSTTRPAPATRATTSQPARQQPAERSNSRGGE
jgi:hypothetical protein